MKKAFTLIELLVVVLIITILGALLFPAISKAIAESSRAISAHSLQQLLISGNLYLADHNRSFWQYEEYTSDGGTMWWFGWESSQSRWGAPEGFRTVDYSRGPLGPYAIATGGVKTDPAFLSYPHLKPKYLNGNYGYGFNGLLVGESATRFERPSQIVVFATCAQVNTFQAPASPANPMVEEFYLIDDWETTVHFRHGNKALAGFLDGSVREMEMAPGTLDTNMPEANVGRFAPVGSKQYLQ